MRYVAAVLTMLFTTACERGAHAPAGAAPERPHVVVLGLDAGTWDLLDPWMAKGELPNLAHLKANGVYGKLRSTQPSNSPVIWTSIATGKVPEKTGITWFVRFPNGPGKPVPVDRTQLRTSTLWDMMSRERIDVAVLGWYVTWPAEQVNGRILTDLAHFGAVEDSRFPPGYLFDLEPIPEKDAVAAMPRFMNYAYDPKKADKPKPGEKPTLDYLVFDRFVRAWRRDKFYLEAARRVLSDGPLPEALFLYLRGTDDVQHGFWKFMDPEAFRPRNGPDGKPLGGTTEVPPAEVEAFGNVIERYWQWIDEEIGKLLRRYSQTTPLVIVCSDHGAGPAVGEDQVEVPQYLHLSGSHRIDGFLIANGPGIRSDGRGIRIDGATIYDIAPTILHAMNLPIGKDMDGHVLTSMFEDDVAARKDELVETWDTGRRDEAAPNAQQEEKPAAPPADVDKKVLEHLRSLGYIGD